MLSRTQLEGIAQSLTHGNMGHAETLYLQDLLLATVGRETADQLVFKGGTALLKFYQLDRFSDDLDFTERGNLDYEELFEKAERDLDNYGASVVERTINRTDTTVNARFGIRGPLYTGTRQSLNFVRIEVNRASGVRDVQVRRYTPPFPDIPSIEVAVLGEAEILAEKLRALMTRRQPRDLYDVYHLLEKSVDVDPELVQQKFDYYDIAYEPAALLDRVKTFERQWADLGTLTYSDPPPFAKAIETLEQGVG